MAYYETRTESRTYYESGQTTQVGGGTTTHTASEGSRTDTETANAFNTTRRQVNAAKSRTSTKTVAAYTVNTVRDARQHVVRNAKVAAAVDVQRKAYSHDGFAFECELIFPNRIPRDLSGGGGDLLSCPA